MTNSQNQELLNDVLCSYIDAKSKHEMDEGEEYYPLSYSEVVACCNIISMIDGTRIRQDIIARLAMCLDDDSYKRIYLTLGASFIEKCMGKTQ